MEISALAISNSGKLMATGQRGTIFQKTPEAPIIIWSYEQKKPLAVLKGMQECINKLAFSPDDQFLCGISANNMFCIWNVRDGNPIHTRYFEHPLSIVVWGDILTDQNPKHPTYSLITGNYNQIFINRLEFDISSM